MTAVGLIAALLRGGLMSSYGKSVSLLSVIECTVLSSVGRAVSERSVQCAVLCSDVEQ